jgi:hypothetical protein
MNTRPKVNRLICNHLTASAQEQITAAKRLIKLIK